MKKRVYEIIPLLIFGIVILTLFPLDTIFDALRGLNDDDLLLANYYLPGDMRSILVFYFTALSFSLAHIIYISFDQYMVSRKQSPGQTTQKAMASHSFVVKVCCFYVLVSVMILTFFLIQPPCHKATLGFWRFSTIFFTWLCCFINYVINHLMRKSNLRFMERLRYHALIGSILFETCFLAIYFHDFPAVVSAKNLAVWFIIGVWSLWSISYLLLSLFCHLLDTWKNQ